MTKQKHVCLVVCVSENRTQSIWQIKKLPIQQEKYRHLTCSNKLWHVRSTFYKLTFFSSKPLCHRFPMLLFTSLARNATITISSWHLPERSINLLNPEAQSQDYSQLYWYHNQTISWTILFSADTLTLAGWYQGESSTDSWRYSAFRSWASASTIQQGKLCSTGGINAYVSLWETGNSSPCDIYE